MDCLVGGHRRRSGVDVCLVGDRRRSGDRAGPLAADAPVGRVAAVPVELVGEVQQVHRDARQDDTVAVKLDRGAGGVPQQIIGHRRSVDREGLQPILEGVIGEQRQLVGGLHAAGGAENVAEDHGPRGVEVQLARDGDLVMIGRAGDLHVEDRAVFELELAADGGAQRARAVAAGRQVLVGADIHVGGDDRAAAAEDVVGLPHLQVAREVERAVDVQLRAPAHFELAGLEQAADLDGRRAVPLAPPPAVTDGAIEDGPVGAGNQVAGLLHVAVVVALIAVNVDAHIEHGGLERRALHAHRALAAHLEEVRLEEARDGVRAVVAVHVRVVSDANIPVGQHVKGACTLRTELVPDEHFAAGVNGHHRSVVVLGVHVLVGAEIVVRAGGVEVAVDVESGPVADMSAAGLDLAAGLDRHVRARVVDLEVLVGGVTVVPAGLQEAAVTHDDLAAGVGLEPIAGGAGAGDKRAAEVQHAFLVQMELVRPGSGSDGHDQRRAVPLDVEVLVASVAGVQRAGHPKGAAVDPQFLVDGGQVGDLQDAAAPLVDSCGAGDRPAELRVEARLGAEGPDVAFGVLQVDVVGDGERAGARLGTEHEAPVEVALGQQRDRHAGVIGQRDGEVPAGGGDRTAVDDIDLVEARAQFDLAVAGGLEGRRLIIVVRIQLDKVRGRARQARQGASANDDPRRGGGVRACHHQGAVRVAVPADDNVEVAVQRAVGRDRAALEVPVVIVGGGVRARQRSAGQQQVLRVPPDADKESLDRFERAAREIQVRDGDICARGNGQQAVTDDQLGHGDVGDAGHCPAGDFQAAGAGGGVGAAGRQRSGGGNDDVLAVDQNVRRGHVNGRVDRQGVHVDRRGGVGEGHARRVGLAGGEGLPRGDVQRTAGEEGFLVDRQAGVYVHHAGAEGELAGRAGRVDVDGFAVDEDKALDGRHAAGHVARPGARGVIVAVGGAGQRSVLHPRSGALGQQFGQVGAGQLFVEDRHLVDEALEFVADEVLGAVADVEELAGVLTMSVHIVPARAPSGYAVDEDREPVADGVVGHHELVPRVVVNEVARPRGADPAGIPFDFSLAAAIAHEEGLGALVPVGIDRGPAHDAALVGDGGLDVGLPRELAAEHAHKVRVRRGHVAARTGVAVGVGVQRLAATET